MAKVQGYWHDNDDETYDEGPFVLCALLAFDDYRVECELKGHECSTFPDMAVYKMACSFFSLDLLRGRKEVMEPVVDWLNQKVERGEIVLKEDGHWGLPQSRSEAS